MTDPRSDVVTAAVPPLPSAGDAARRSRVLVSAYSCGPGRGSEPGVGWNWVLAWAQDHDVSVLTSREFEADIRRCVEAGEAAGVAWVFHDVGPRWQGWRRSTALQHLHYYLWQLTACAVARRLHARCGFDLVHHATLAIYWRPAAGAFVGAPLVWGPVGGAEVVPRALRPTLSWRGRALEAVRAAAQRLGARDPLLRQTARRARLALAATHETAERLRRLGARDVRVVESVGLTAGEVARLARLPVRTAGPFRVLSAGVLVGWKGFHLGIAAFAQLAAAHPTAEYWVLGDGVERRALEALARRLGVADRVRFWGTVPRARVLDLLGECDVMLHPSMHDSGCFATLEAMAAGRPVVCLDVGGPARQVTEATGVKVAPGAPEQVVRDLAAALGHLCDDPARRGAMADAGRRRAAEHFLWARKAAALDAWLRPRARAEPGPPRPACDAVPA